jgi:hypothetical protein
MLVPCVKLLGLLSVAAALSGCGTFTARLWRPDDVKGLHAAARPIHLQIYSAELYSPDVLVEYDEATGIPPVVTRKYYWLKANQDRMKRGKSPVFVKESERANLRPIKQIAPPAFGKVTESVPVLFVSTNSNTFSIRHFGGLNGDYLLPAYGTLRPLAERVLLTPAMIATDSAIVTGAATGAAAAAGAIPAAALLGGAPAIDFNRPPR